MTDRAKIVDFYLQKISDTGFEISEVRKDLERNNFDNEEIKVIVRLVDNELQRRLLKSANNEKAKGLVFTGAVITLVGIAITFGTYTGLIDMGNSFLIAYGPILAGLSILFTGLAKRRRV
jgi:hypothetical protein